MILNCYFWTIVSVDNFGIVLSVLVITQVITKTDSLSTFLFLIDNIDNISFVICLLSWIYRLQNSWQVLESAEHRQKKKMTNGEIIGNFWQYCIFILLPTNLWISDASTIHVHIFKSKFDQFCYH